MQLRLTIGSGSGEHSLGVLYAQQVVRADGPPQSHFAQVLVLVLAQPGDGLETAESTITRLSGQLFLA